MANELWTKPKRIIAIIFSSTCMIVMILRFIFPSLLFDQYSLGLIAVAFLPWMTLFFKEITFPGGGGVKIEKDQGVSDPVNPKTIHSVSKEESQEAEVKRVEIKGVARIAPDISNDAKKILQTLWRYQVSNFKDDFSKRWTFSIYPNAQSYASYIKGLGELLNRNYVIVSPENNQVMLTNEGIHYIQNTEDVKNYSEFYVF